MSRSTTNFAMTRYAGGTNTCTKIANARTRAFASPGMTDRFVTQSQHSVKPQALVLFEYCVYTVSIGMAAYLWLAQ
jgi:hypothetical protein